MAKTKIQLCGLCPCSVCWHGFPFRHPNDFQKYTPLLRWQHHVTFPCLLVVTWEGWGREGFNFNNVGSFIGECLALRQMQYQTGVWIGSMTWLTRFKSFYESHIPFKTERKVFIFTFRCTANWMLSQYRISAMGWSQTVCLHERNVKHAVVDMIVQRSIQQFGLQHQVRTVSILQATRQHLQLWHVSALFWSRFRRCPHGQRANALPRFGGNFARGFPSVARCQPCQSMFL